MANKTVNMTKLKYTSLPGGTFAWQDPQSYKPLPFDLVQIDTGEKEVRGWWTGNRWMGLRLREKDKVVSWKRCSEQDFI
jgi:hypothetical protein